MEGSSNTNPIAAAASTADGGASSSPWTQIVRGPESDHAGAPSSPPAGDRNIPSAVENLPESSDNGNGNGNAGNNKKPAWNKKPANGSVEAGAVVMGAASWPALSESTKASPKLSPSDSPKIVPDSGSDPAPQVTGIVLPSSSSSSLLSSSPLPSPTQSSLTSPKPTTSVSHNPTSNNHGRPARQKSMKREGGGNNPQANGGFSHPPSLGEGSHNHNSSVKPSFGGSYDSSNRDHSQNHANRDGGSRNAGGDHPQQRNSFRRGNGGPHSHSRGDGSHQNYGGRRGDQDRGNHDWNHQRSFNGRDAPLQPRVGPRGYVRTPPVSAPFVHPAAGPAPMRPFMNPMAMPDMHQMYYFQTAMPFVAPVPPMYFPAPDPQLLARIVTQIDYYFSNENLIKDTYLRQLMDEEGWVPVAKIAEFKKVQLLTDSIQLIIEAVRNSSVVEAQGDRIRRRDDWMRWLMPKFPIGSGSQSPKSPNVAAASAHIHNLTLDEMTTGVAAEALLRSSSGDSSSPSHKDGASSSGY